ncbi:MAG: hypothetical protein LBK73_01170 [Treponema sp.]|jgi:TolB-like protein|nr:hypothetical protein [Treponema sp.]
MKRTIFGLLAFFAVEIVCAQAKLPIVAVNTFDTVGSVSSDEVAVVTELFMSLIDEGKKVNVVDRNSFDKIVQQLNFQITDWSDNDKVAQLGQALNVEYIIRGQIMKMGNAMYLSATMLDVNTTAIIASAREQLGGFDELFATLPKLSRQLLNGLPEPNSAQVKLPIVAVTTFDTVGSVSSDEVAVVTELFMSLIVEGKKVNVVDRNSFDKISQQMNFQITDWSDNDKVAQLGQALNVEYIIRGQIMKMGNAMYLSSTMLDVNTTAIIVSAREQLGGFDELFTTLPKLSRQLLNGLPEPNYLVGKWRTSDSKCILEFKADRTIIVERYDYEYNLNSGARSDGPVGEGTASGQGSYSTAYPASGGSITINLHLTGPADMTRFFGQDVSFENYKDGLHEYYSQFAWNNSTKNSFRLYYKYHYYSWKNDQQAGLPTYRYRYDYGTDYSRNYKEFIRIQ